jgi:hypothetical protein
MTPRTTVLPPLPLPRVMVTAYSRPPNGLMN